MAIEVRFYAALRQYAPEGSAGIVTVSANAGTGITIEDILKNLNVDLDEVKIIMLNGVHAELSQPLADGDRLGVFPLVGGG